MSQSLYMRRELDDQRRQEIDQLLYSLDMNPPETEQGYALYHHALTHSSYTYENKLSSLENYERLEFLGDAVLKLIVSDYLYDRFPDYREGELTKIRAVIVSDATLAKFAQDIHLGDYVIFGGSEARSGGKTKPSNLACAFESFLGALFIDGRLADANELMVNLLADEVTHVDMNPTKNNYKAVLQELTQAEGRGLPEYRTIKEVGPAHNRQFYIDVLVQGEVLGHGQGCSKKEAQQNAAKLALEALGEL